MAAISTIWSRAPVAKDMKSCCRCRWSRSTMTTGPQTLLSSLSGEQNVDRMQWLMSRFQGYVGVTNQMGARFTASEASLAPVLRETAKRGLIYVDDGSSTRSLASQIAGANKVPFAKADVIIDTVPTIAEIDKALVRLETIARGTRHRDRLRQEPPCRSPSSAWRGGPRPSPAAASCWCRSRRSRTNRNRASVPIPKFASFCGIPKGELRIEGH